MEFIEAAVAAADYEGRGVYGLDLTATEFFEQEKERYAFEREIYTRRRFIERLKSLVQRFPLIVSLEDPLMEHDFERFSRITAEIPDTMIIGDDLFATNRRRIQKGVEKIDTHL